MLARGSGDGQRNGGILGIGLDLVEMDRMRGLLERRDDTFVGRVHVIL